MNEQQKLICEILQLAYLVHEFTDYCVFINFSGHVDLLEVSIRASQEHYNQKVLETQFYTEFRKYQYEKRDPLAYYKAKRDILLHILKEKEIPYEDCIVEHYVIEEYTF